MSQIYAYAVAFMLGVGVGGALSLNACGGKMIVSPPPQTVDAIVSLAPGALGSFQVSANEGRFTVSVPAGYGTQRLVSIAAGNPALLGGTARSPNEFTFNPSTPAASWSWSNVGGNNPSAAGVTGTVTVTWYDAAGAFQTSTVTSFRSSEPDGLDSPPPGRIRRAPKWQLVRRDRERQREPRSRFRARRTEGPWACRAGLPGSGDRPRAIPSERLPVRLDGRPCDSRGRFDSVGRAVVRPRRFVHTH